ncbi:hypothetical protein TWF506_005976 [Arthrobotrys conoides]|uniref:Uncharacterized protein n=1 Tax=Arthrobotrys conoides TaxID=74498 RepID=A0AAN8RNM7_9PEZI
MSNYPNGRPGDALLGALVTVLSVLVVGLLTLVTYLYFQLRKIHQKYKELLKESSTSSTSSTSLCQRIREQRKSAILHMVTDNDLEQQRDLYISSPISQHSDFTLKTMELSKPKIYPTDINSIEPSSPEREPWGIRKVRSIERLTGLTNELSMKSDRRDHSSEHAMVAQDHNPFYGQGEIFEYDITKPSIDPKFIQGGEMERGQALDVQYSKIRSPETVGVDAIHEQISCHRHETQFSGPSLLAVPQPSCFKRTQISRPTITSISTPINKSESESNIPPHARSLVLQDLYEDPLGTFFTNNTNPNAYGPSSIDSLEHYDRDEVPRPFLERSFSLNLAYSDPAEEISIKNRNSAGRKLKLYLKNARGHRKTIGSTQGKSAPPSKSPEGTISKTKRDLFRLPKTNREESPPQPLSDEGTLSNN